MESFLRKYFWTIDFGVAAVCALLLAHATASLAESKLAENAPPRGYSGNDSAAHAGTVYAKNIDKLLERNMFCSSCPPFNPPPVDLPAGEGGVAGSGAVEAQKTSMPIALMAIMYAPPPAGIKYSMAVIRDNDTKGAGAYRIGDAVRDAKVIGIEETRIHFDNRGKPEYLDLLEPPPDATPAKKADDAPAEKASPGDALGEELDRGLKKTGDHTYELQRGTLEQVLGNMSLLSRSARIVPEIREGKPAGFRLYSVRPEGPFAKIGMQNGDVIYAINGLEMSSPERALEVYSKLKSARHLSVSLERNGQKITKEYGIR